MAVCITLGSKYRIAQNAEYHGHSKIKVEFLKPPKIHNSFSADKQELMTIVSVIILRSQNICTATKSNVHLLIHGTAIPLTVY